MREIKFRAWIKVSQKIASWEMIKEKKNLHRLIENPEYLLMQYTELKDKNGVEIYEGDIVKAIWSKDCEKYIANEIWIGDIFFNCGSFDINSEWCVALNCFNGALEVIGNIYDNKELLNENK